MMGYSTYTRAILVNFSKKKTFWEVNHTQFGRKLCNLLSYDLLFDDFFEMLQHERIHQEYNSNSQICQNISFRANGQFGSYLGKKYTALFCSINLDLRIFLRCFSVIGHNKKKKQHRKISLKKSVLGQIAKKFNKILFSEFNIVLFN